MFHKIVTKYRWAGASTAIILGLMAAPSHVVFANPPEKKAQHLRPVIGVSGNGPDSFSVKSIMAALRAAGAEPLLLNIPDKAVWPQQMATLHGIVIAGNRLDINPADYDETVEDATVNEETESETPWEAGRDDVEYALIKRAMDQHIPFLGICSGMQRLNVARGGKLIQHVDGQRQWMWGKLPHQTSETAMIAGGSRLAAVVVDHELPINSLHHQAIDPEHVGDKLRIVATNTKHQTVEAVEGDPTSHPFLIGVQWHPEWLNDEASRRLFAALVDAARDYARRRNASLNNPADDAMRPVSVQSLKAVGESHNFR